MHSPTRLSSHKNSRTLGLLAAALCAAGLAGHAQALPVVDASNDFLPSYTGAKDADFDVLQADVVIDPKAQTVTFSATMKGNIDTRSPRALALLRHQRNSPRRTFATDRQRPEHPQTKG